MARTLKPKYTFKVAANLLDAELRFVRGGGNFQPDFSILHVPVVLYGDEKKDYRLDYENAMRVSCEHYKGDENSLKILQGLEARMKECIRMEMLSDATARGTYAKAALNFVVDFCANRYSDAEEKLIPEEAEMFVA